MKTIDERQGASLHRAGCVWERAIVSLPNRYTQEYFENDKKVIQEPDRRRPKLTSKNYLSRAVNHQPGIRPADPYSWRRFSLVVVYSVGKIFRIFTKIHTYDSNKKKSNNKKTNQQIT